MIIKKRGLHPDRLQEYPLPLMRHYSSTESLCSNHSLDSVYSESLYTTSQYSSSSITKYPSNPNMSIKSHDGSLVNRPVRSCIKMAHQLYASRVHLMILIHHGHQTTMLLLRLLRTVLSRPCPRTNHVLSTPKRQMFCCIISTTISRPRWTSQH